VLWRNIEQRSVIVGETKYLGLNRGNNRCKRKEGCCFSFWKNDQRLPKKSFFFLSGQELFAVSHTAIERVFSDLWPDCVKSDNVFLLVTRAHRAWESSRTFTELPWADSVASVARALHTVYGTILVLYPNVDKWLMGRKSLWSRQLQYSSLRTSPRHTIPLNFGEPGWRPLLSIRETLRSFVLS
jgi:hypothetical protein